MEAPEGKTCPSAFDDNSYCNFFCKRLLIVQLKGTKGLSLGRRSDYESGLVFRFTRLMARLHYIRLVGCTSADGSRIAGVLPNSRVLFKLQEDLGLEMSNLEATEMLSGTSFCGHLDWRLPTVQELKLMHRFNQSDRYTKKENFEGEYLSSTYVGIPSISRVFNFSTGTERFCDIDTTRLKVLPVRTVPLLH